MRRASDDLDQVKSPEPKSPHPISSTNDPFSLQILPKRTRTGRPIKTTQQTRPRLQRTRMHVHTHPSAEIRMLRHRRWRRIRTRTRSNSHTLLLGCSRRASLEHIVYCSSCLSGTYACVADSVCCGDAVTEIVIEIEGVRCCARLLLHC